MPLGGPGARRKGTRRPQKPRQAVFRHSTETSRRRSPEVAGNSHHRVYGNLCRSPRDIWRGTNMSCCRRRSVHPGGLRRARDPPGGAVRAAGQRQDGTAGGAALGASARAGGDTARRVLQRGDRPGPGGDPVPRDEGDHRGGAGAGGRAERVKHFKRIEVLNGAGRGQRLRGAEQRRPARPRPGAELLGLR